MLEARALITHLHASAENERAALRSKLQDELGALMASAAMDIVAATQHLELDDPAQRELGRATDTLQKAIDISGRLVEELRPSILDNMGLFAALRWQLEQASRRTQVVCTHLFPEVEPRLTSEACVNLFRIAEEALGLIFKRESVTAADFNIRMADGDLCMKFTDDGSPEAPSSGAVDPLASLRHRIREQGGTIDVVRTSDARTVLTARIPSRESRAVSGRAV